MRQPSLLATLSRASSSRLLTTTRTSLGGPCRDASHWQDGSSLGGDVRPLGLVLVAIPWCGARPRATALAQPVFEPGRLNHFALNAASEEAFREIRRRVLAEGANATEGGLVKDIGALLSFTFHDPDDTWVEAMWSSPESGSRTPRPGRPSGR
jgi:hypothetical protein